MSRSAAAGSALDANAAATAAIILGAGAPRWLAERGLAARLVGVGNDIVTVSGWPVQTDPGHQAPGREGQAA